MSREKRMVTIITSKNGMPIRFNKVPGRNDLCHCQSGKKYKACHLLYDEQKLMGKIK